MVRKKLLWISLTIPLILSVFSVTMMGVTVAQVIHDIAVVSVTPSPTPVKLGQLVNITVVVKNNGTMNETFDVTAYYETTTIETKAVQNLVAGSNTSLIFTWNTTDVREEIYSSVGHRKTYTIRATASIVPGETNTEDNTLVSGVYVFVPHYIAVIPQTTVDTTLTPGKNYTVSIYTDYNGTDIWGWEFDLTYNPSVLEGVEVTNGDLITKAKNETAKFMLGTFNNNLGKLSLTGAAFLYPGTPLPLTSGPGTLANVTFKVVGTGDSYITLGTETVAPSRLIGVTEDGYGDQYNIIDDIEPWLDCILHGYFRNTAEPITHDIAILSVTPSPTWIETGEPVNVTVVVKNNGTRTEKGIEVKLYYDSTAPNWLIETQTISTLEAGANTSLIFTWDETDIWPGTHLVIVVADAVHGETDTENNALNERVIVSVFYIRANGSIDPFWAPISSVDNVTYTFTSDILNVSIVVERDNIVVDGAGYTIQGGWTGIDLSRRNNVTIRNMEIKAFDYGIWLFRSSNNIIYHNNFVDNTEQVHSYDSTNVWDDGYPSGGNYWSNYEERYPGAQELNDSGIWDTPYVVDENNQDNYPLMNPWTPAPPTIVATADVVPNTLNLKSRGKWITCYLELPENHNVSNINRTTVLLNHTIPIDSFWIDKLLESVIGDYDNDGITDLMVKFDRQALIEYIETKGITDAEVTLAITGKANGKSFEVTDTIKVIGQ